MSRSGEPRWYRGRMILTGDQRAYALVSFVAVPAVANALINGVLGWATLRGASVIPMWSLGPAIGPDLLGTCFFLPLITCLIVTAITHKHRREGRVTPLRARDAAFARSLPGGSSVGAFKRGLLLGVLALPAAGGATISIFWMLGVDELPLGSLLVFKVIFSVLLGCLVTPVIGLLALADPEPAIP